MSIWKTAADTLAYFAERLQCDSLRNFLHDLYTRLQCNHHLTDFRMGGWTVLAVDCHARWEIENQGFNQLVVNQLHFNHPFHHHPNAIMVFALTACIVQLLLSAFYQFNLKAEQRVRCSLSALALMFLQSLDDLLDSK